MNQQTLDLIGRKHTVEQIKNVYSMAREEGFNNINMDIILGLVGEDVDEVAHTLSEIEAMKPESLTVHSLAIKRAAALNIWRDKYKQLSTNNTDEIIRMTEDTAKRLSMDLIICIVRRIWQVILRMSVTQLRDLNVYITFLLWRKSRQ